MDHFKCSPVEKQIYTLELLIKLKIYDIFYMLLFEQDVTKKRWVNKNNEMEFDIDKNESEEYQVEAI